jgi:hypothetical protein
MELFGIALSVPAALVVGVLYSSLIERVTAKFPSSKIPVLVASAIVLTALALEWCLLGTLGAVRGREVIGPAFYPVHLAVFFLSIPALANIVVLRKPESSARGWLMAGVLCAALALPIVLTHYAVSEVLYGIDGSGGPYGKLIFGALVAWVVYRYIRYNYLLRRRVQKFLSDNRVDFRRVKYAPEYGWPGYVVVFNSPQKRDAFRNSPVFEALIGEVQNMHGDLKIEGRSFDARLAVGLEPIDLQVLGR